MLNKQTLDFLKIIGKFTDVVLLRYPVTCGISQDKDIVYSVDLSKFDTDGFEQTLGIHKLNSFLNMFSLFGEDYEIDVDNKSITVKDPNTSVRYLLAVPEAISSYDAQANQFDLTANIPSVLEFDLTTDIIKKLKAGASSFSELNTVLFEGGDNPNISLVQTESREGMSSNAIKINIHEEAKKNFKTGISIITLSRLPLGDYRVSVKYNESKDKYRIYLESKDIEGFKIILPVLAKKF